MLQRRFSCVDTQSLRVGLLALFLTFLLPQSPLSAQEAEIPSTLSYQGQLSGKTGKPVADGRYTITAAIYSDALATEPLWTERHEADLVRGIFNLQLGSINPLDLPFDQVYWLGIAIGSEPELFPRTELSSSPYAFRAGVASSLEGGAVTGINGLDGDVRIVGQGGALVTASNGLITIAMTTPKDVMAGKKVEITPKKAQKANKDKSVIHLNETHRKSPNLIEMEVGGIDKFVVQNDGDVVSAGTFLGRGLAIVGSTKLGNGIGSDNLTVNVGNGAVSFSKARLQNVADPTSPQDAATKSFVEKQVATVGGGGEPLLTFGIGSSNLTDNRVVVAGTGVTITNSGVDNGALTIGIGQDVASTSSPSFAAMTLAGSLDVAGATSLGGVLDVAGAATIGGAASVTGDLAVGGDGTFTGSLSGLSISGSDLTLTGNASIGGTAAVDGDLDVGGSATFLGELSALSISGGDLTLTGDASIGGSAIVGGNLTIDGSATFLSELSALSISGGDLTLTGNASIGGSVSALSISGGSFILTDDATIGGSASIGGDLDVGGSLGVTENLTVIGDLSGASLGLSGHATIDSSASVGTDLDVGANLMVTDDLTVGGDATINGETLMNDDLIITGDLEVSDDVDVAGGLEVGADMEVSEGAEIGTDLLVNGAGTFGGALSAASISTTGNASVGGSADVTTDLSVGANLTVTDDLTVSGDATINGETLMNDDLIITGDLEVSDDVDVSGGLEVGADIEVTEGVEIGGDLQVSGDITGTSATLESTTMALELADGGLQLSTATYTADAVTPPTIGTDKAAALVTAAAVGAGDDINVPATGSTGQMVIVTNSTGGSIDLLGTAAGAVAIPDGEGISILYDGTSWIAVR